MTTVNRSRMTWVDHAKGVGIFLVVLGHTLRGLQASQIIPDSPSFHAVDSWIYSFHMPLFFLLAGLFAERRVEKSADEFLRDKLETLAYPYLIWSLLQTIVQFAVSRYTNHPTSLSDLTRILIYPIMQFWFLYVLFLISLAYYFLRRCGLGPLGVLAVFAVLWLSQRWVSLIPWWPLSLAAACGIYYGLGSVINQHGGAERIGRAPRTVLAMTVILGYAIVTVAAWRPQGEIPLVALTVALSGIAASVALGVLLSRAVGLDMVRLCGAFSLEIYVAHTIASAGLRIALQKALKVQDATAHIVIGTVGGLVLPLILALLCRWYHAGFLFRFPRRASYSPT